MPLISKNAVKKSLALLLALLLAVSPLLTVSVRAEEYESSLPLVGGFSDADEQIDTDEASDNEASFDTEEILDGEDSSSDADAPSAIEKTEAVIVSGPSIGTMDSLETLYKIEFLLDGGEGNGIPSVTEAPAGAEVTMTFIPVEGFAVYASWVLNLAGPGGSYTILYADAITNNKYTFIMPAADVLFWTDFEWVGIQKVYEEPTNIGGVYQLETAEHLLWLSEQCKTTPAVNVKLVNDIDATAIEWVPIGTTNALSYKGEFDGNNKTVTLNYEASVSNYSGHGFFGVIGAGANVHDLTIEGSVTSDVNGTSPIAGLAGNMTGGTVSNVTNKAIITGKDTNTVAGLVGTMSGGTLSNVTNEAAILGTGTNTGGIVGTLSGSSVIENALNAGDVKTTSVGTNAYIGGIAGQMQNGQIRSSENRGDVVAACRYVAGIAAIVSAGTVTDNTNTGNVTNNASSQPYTGGITSYLTNSVASFGGNANRGTVSAVLLSATHLGSLIGYNAATANKFTSNSYYELGGLKAVGTPTYVLDDVLIGFLPVGVTEFAVKTTDPAKLTYRAGDLFDPSGITVTLTTSDGTGSIDVTTTILGVDAITGWDKVGALTVADSSVVVQFAADGLLAPIDVTVPITVIDVDELTNLRIVTQPVKKMYTQGESFDKTDITLRAVYGSVEIVLLPGEWELTPAIFSTEDTKITISYGGKEVEVKDFTILPGSVPQIDTDGSYLLGTVDELLWFAGYATGYPASKARLTSNIDMTGVKWRPIGEPLTGSVVSFTGTFDGNGKVISNLSIIERRGSLGFFSSINGATIKDLALVGLTINSLSTAGSVGGIAATAGRTAPSTISGCYVSGSITSGGLTAGGLLGSSTTAVTIENCRVDGSIKATYQMGGLIGWYNAGAGALNISNCIITATIEGTLDDPNGNAYVGGLIGNRTNSTGIMNISDTRILSEKIASINGLTTGVLYGGGSSGTFTPSDVSAWKGLNFVGTPLKDILYGDRFFSEARNGSVMLSWKLATAAGWPTAFTSGGVWTYSAGKLPVLTQFAAVMSDEFPAYMSDYLVNPGAADASALTAAVAAAELLLQVDYSDGWDDFQLSFIRIKRVLADNESSQAELDTALAALEAAFALLDARNSLVLAGAGTEADPYLIANAEQLMKMNRIVNSNEVQYRSAYYKLTDNIDMDGQEWLPLGGTTAATAFTGGFDGDNKTISNLSVRGGSRIGMFGYITDATIKNLTLEDCKMIDTGDSGYVAGLAAESAGHSFITNCHVNGEILGISNTAGLVARISTNASITIKNCSVSGRVRGELINGYSGGSYIGGFIAWVQGGAGAGSVITIEDSTMSADVYGGANYTGGFVGYFTANNTVVIKNCDVILSETANIVGNRWVGGISGNTVANNNTASMTIENCTVTGGKIKALTTTISSEIGGLIGEIPNNGRVNITDCYVQTNIEGADDKAGGLVGVKSGATGTLTITRSAYIGTVTGATYVGGLVGYGTNITITDCYSGGMMSGSESVGGLLAYKLPGGNVTITNSFTTASLHGGSYVGGILGRQLTSDTGTFSATGVRALGETITRERLSSDLRFGGLSGEAQYTTSYYSLTNTFAWTGMKLLGTPLAEIPETDELFSTWRNGTGFLGWSLKTADGWPTALTNNGGAWTYTAGRMPVLTKFAGNMSDALPTYLSAIPGGTVANKTVLQAIIAEATGMSAAVYSIESVVWADVQEKLIIARQVESLYDADQALVDEVESALTAAVTELKRLTDITFTGSGTTGAPYEISNIDQLLKMNRLVNSPDTTTRNTYRAAHYTLTANIDMSGISWAPLGGSANATAFTGSFEGGGNTISNMEVSGGSHLGFFGFVSGAKISNLTIRDFTITGIGLNNLNNMGAISGQSASATTITNCHAIGTLISRGSNLGGITGQIDGTISGCTADINLISTADNGGSIGGIAGNFTNGLVENCSVTGTIECRATWNGETGGIVGNISAGANTATIENCWAKATVTGVSAGGILGCGTSNGAVSDRVVVSNCSFDGMLFPAYTNVTTFMGGIVGRMLNNVKIIDCRSDGTINMATVAGGIVGRFGGMLAGNVSITNSYTTMRIGNSTTAGGIVGDFVSPSANATGKLVITDTFALNEQVSGSTAANAIHAFGEGSDRLDYTLSGVKVWDGMLVRLDGVAQATPAGAISYADLQSAANWQAGFKSAPWSYTAGKLPVLSNGSGMSANFPTYITSAETPTDISDTTELLDLINTANSLVQGTYTAASWARLMTEVNAATTLMRNPQATPGEVTAALTALQTAIDELELYKVATTLAGDGSAESPFLVGSAADYEEMARLLGVSAFYRSASYKMTSNIDLLGVIRSPMPYTTATAMTEMAFSGDFNGAGFTISNLRIEHSWATGMFGYTDGATIHDFTLADCDIYGAISNTGAIVGHARDTAFENINITGRVEGSTNLGGLAGTGISSTAKNCHFEGVVDTHDNTSANNIGGMFGSFGNLIEDCSFKGAINYNGISLSYLSMGGLVGTFTGGDIIGCTVEADINYKYNTGDATVNNGPDVGGIAGTFTGNSIVDSHFKGTINARGANVGGIAGNFTGNLIQGCTTEGELKMNWPTNSGQGDRRPAGGIVGNINTGTDRDVVIDDCTSSMSINGFREAGGIAGAATGTGSITISNSKALNDEINNSRSDFHVDPFFFGSDTFGGQYTADNNYISEEMLINGKTVVEWMQDTMSDKYDDSTGFTFGPQDIPVINPPTPPVIPPNPNPNPTPPPTPPVTPSDPSTPVNPAPPSDPNTPAPQPPANPDPVPPAPVTPDTGTTGNTNNPSSSYRPSGNVQVASPLVLEAENPDQTLPNRDDSSQEENTPPDDEQPPDTAENIPAPQISDITIDPTRINPAVIIIPLIVILAAVGVIGFIRLKKNKRT